MLSRVADGIYWMSRYLERAEHTARLLDLTLHQMPDSTPEDAARRWDRVVAALRAPIAPGTDAYTITAALTFDASNPGSIVGAVAEARDNARQAWEQISTEMWEQLNRLHLSLAEVSMNDMWYGERHALYGKVKEGIHLCQGVTDATMTHGEGWQFIQVGRYVERVTRTARLLDVYYSPTTDLHDDTGDAGDYLDWVGLLKSCSAFEAYVKVFSATVRPDHIAAFLLLDADFPRSVRFGVRAVQAALHEIGHDAGNRGGGRPERQTGRLLAVLDYSSIEELLEGDLHLQLEAIQEGCLQINRAIYSSYIDYPLGAALAARRRGA